MLRKPDLEKREAQGFFAARGTGFDPSGSDILTFALNEQKEGRTAAIATLAEIHGATPRRLGSQMAISDDGRYAGSISSGCLERAIVDQARSAIREGEGRLVRYGEGSRYLDIVLPCGSGLDILYTVNMTPGPLEHAIDAMATRRPSALAFHKSGAETVERQSTGRDGAAFIKVYHPPMNIVAAGAGSELITLSRVSAAAGYHFHALSPDNETLGQCAGTRSLLHSSSAANDIALDPWAAFVFLFHDREWELALAPDVLASEAFYIGAVGSRNTQAARLDACRTAGVSEQRLSKLKGPVGLIPATRDPAALAVSILAEIISAWPHK